MKHFLSTFLVASLFAIGCGQYVTQTELDTTTNQLRSDVSAATEQSVGFAHECSMTKGYIDSAAQACLFARMQGHNPENVVTCIMVSAWQETCIATDDEGNLLVPQESILKSLDAIATAAAAAATEEETASE